MRTAEIERVRRRLTAERDRLSQLCDELHEEVSWSSWTGRSELVGDVVDASVGTIQRRDAETFRVMVSRRLVEIDDALARMDDGTYGRCETCGRAIARDRLRTLPLTTHCLADQARAEQQARMS